MGQFINQYQTLTLNGVRRSGAGLALYCNQQLNTAALADWEIGMYQFVLDWLSPDDYVMAQTSGSTGAPKPIKLLKKHMIASAQKTLSYFKLHANDTALLPLSAHYIAGKMMLVRAFVGALNIIAVEPSGNPLLALTRPIKFAPLVPMQVVKALESLGNNWPVEIVIIGGGVLADVYKKDLAQKNTAFYETYGMTETVSHIALKNIKEPSFIAVDGVTFSLDDRECLCIDAPDVVSHQIVTNDIVNLESPQSFTFVGRYDNVINTGGVKIVPEQLEGKLASYIKVPFAISAIPHAVLGEQLVLVLTTHAFTQSDLEKLTEVPDLNKFEIPKRFIVIAKVPITDTNKIKRQELKRILLDKASETL